ncbi:MAG: TetR/AcrR family transcriptional regulator [Myxococcaceae bacterium]|nr:TetR/AcrR family transcriptional regulator [Myxococcaceae bacterium]
MAKDSSAAKAPGKREEERRRAILRAAIEVFSRKGYQGCRIADVAKEAGVAYGLVYHYFQNKDELLESVFEAGWSWFLARVIEAAGKGNTFDERVESVVGVAFESYRRDPKAVKVLILEVGRSPSGGAVNRGKAFAHVIQLASQLFEEAQRNGELKPDHDPKLCAAMFFGAIEMGLTGFVMGFIDRREDTLLAAQRQVTETFLRGVSPGTQRTLEAAWTSPKSSSKPKLAKRA